MQIEITVTLLNDSLLTLFLSFINHFAYFIIYPNLLLLNTQMCQSSLPHPVHCFHSTQLATPCTLYSCPKVKYYLLRLASRHDYFNSQSIYHNPIHNYSCTITTSIITLPMIIPPIRIPSMKPHMTTISIITVSIITNTQGWGRNRRVENRQKQSGDQTEVDWRTDRSRLENRQKKSGDQTEVDWRTDRRRVETDRRRVENGQK